MPTTLDLRPPRHLSPTTPLLALPQARWAAGALALFAAGGLAQLAGAPAWLYWALYLACYAAGGWGPALSGLRALREPALDVDLLMVVAALGAAAIGQIFDGALLIVIFATSGALESLATRRTEESVRALLDLAPDTGTRLRPDGGEETVSAEQLQVGDEILLRPGERIAADGHVIGGASEVDQSTITGEPLPAPKSEGQEVFAGTRNGTGTLRVRVRRPAHDTVVARIVAQVQRASATKAKTQLFIERFEQRYSVGMVTATLTIFTVALLLGSELETALLRAMTFMIVASPCAVVLATMPPLLAAISTAGRHGVLVKNAVVLERLAAVDIAALDKTGTLTTGRARLAAIHTLPPAKLQENAALRLAAAAEFASEHPVGRAIVTAARQRGLDLPPARDFTALVGRGVAATVEGHRIEVGSLPALAGPAPTQEPTLMAASTAVQELEERGHTAVVLLRDGAAVAVLGLADTLRTDAASAVRRLARTTHQTVLLTGDNPQAAREVANATGITEVRSGLLPEDKATTVSRMGAQGRRVLVVGDGVNDAPAMATAHTAIAMGGAGCDLALQTSDVVVVRDELEAIPTILALARRARRLVDAPAMATAHTAIAMGGAGCDLALQTSDVVVVRDELEAIPTILALARRARRLVIANLVIAATVIAILITWDLVGYLPLPLGVAGHEGSTVLVALNGMRLLGNRAWRKAARAGGNT